MQRNIWMSLLLLATFLSSNTYSYSLNAEAKEQDKKVALEKTNTKRTRSATSTQVEAYADAHIVTVAISNYHGMAWVEIIGSGGVRMQSLEVYEAGACAMDIASLPSGKYTLRITLENAVYEGTFEK